MTLKLRAAIGIVLAALSVSACDPGGSGVSQDDMMAKLRQRPDIHVVGADYMKLIDGIRSGLGDKYGLTGWKALENPQVTKGTCGPAWGSPSPTVAQAWNIDGGYTKKIIADRDWPGALSVMQKLAAPHGFTKVDVMIDKPGNHTVNIYDPNGAYINVIAMSDHVSFGIKTSCHLMNKSAGQTGTP